MQDVENNPRTLEIMTHALGLDNPKVRRPYRNNYCASVGSDDHTTCLELVGVGLMDKVDVPSGTFVGGVFRVTELGKNLVRAERGGAW